MKGLDQKVNWTYGHNPEIGLFQEVSAKEPLPRLSKW